MKLSTIKELINNTEISDETKETLLKQVKIQDNLDKDKFEDREPMCLKTYFKHIGRLKNLLNNETLLLMELARNSTRKGDIFLCKALKDKIIKKLGISEKTFSNKKTLLKKLKYIKKVSYGVYRINPNYFGKGGWHKIVEQRRAWVRIDIDERGKEQITTSMENLKNSNVLNMENYF